nr:hypothetical protein [Floccifex porci]
MDKVVFKISTIHITTALSILLDTKDKIEEPININTSKSLNCSIKILKILFF